MSSELASFRVSVDNQTGDSITPRLIGSHEYLPIPFTIFRATDASRAVVIPAGNYRFEDAELRLSANGFRRVSGSFTARGGEYYDGSHASGTLVLNYIPTRHVNTSVSYSEDHISLPGGNFVARLASVRADLVLSSHWAWTNTVQYDNLSQVLGVNSRIHWQPRAGRDAYLVLNYGLQDRDLDRNFGSVGWDLALKFNYDLRL